VDFEEEVPAGLMTQLDSSTSDLGSMRQQLVARLEKFRARVRSQLILEGAAKVVAVAVAWRF
jgi:hypothetical protein